MKNCRWDNAYNPINWISRGTPKVYSIELRECVHMYTALIRIYICHALGTFGTSWDSTEECMITPCIHNDITGDVRNTTYWLQKKSTKYFFRSKLSSPQTCCIARAHITQQHKTIIIRYQIYDRHEVSITRDQFECVFDQCTSWSSSTLQDHANLNCSLLASEVFHRQMANSVGPDQAVHMCRLICGWTMSQSPLCHFSHGASNQHKITH